MRSSSLASVYVIEFQTTQEYSSLDLTNVEYNVSAHSSYEKVKVMLRTRLNNLILVQWENIYVVNVVMEMKFRIK
jgi:hypothetical protein